MGPCETHWPRASLYLDPPLLALVILENLPKRIHNLPIPKYLVIIFSKFVD